MSLSLLGPVFLTGLCILQAQILLFREFLVLSHGNELALGAMLMIWLTGSGLGSLAGGRIFRETVGKPKWGLLPLGMAFLLLVSIGGLRCLPSWSGYSWGEILPFPHWIGLAIGTLFPFCFFSGSLFPFFGQFFQKPSFPLRSILVVYWVEALGAAAGGVLGLFLITWIDGIPLALGIGSGLCGCSFWILRNHPQRSLQAGGAFLPLVLGLVVLFLAISQGKEWDKLTRTIQWRPFSLIKNQETAYGSLAVAERAGQLNFFMNGIFQFSFPDPRRAEEKTHLPLLIHPQPKTILLIGGGLSGTLREVLKHPSVQRVDYWEHDPDWVTGVGPFLPDQATVLRSDPRVRLHLGDGRRRLMNTRQTFDLILLDLPGPMTIQLNRFYSREFFRISRDHLNPGGFLVFTLNGATDMLGPSQFQVLKTLNHTLQETFPGTLVLAGEEFFFLGFKEKRPGSIDLSILKQRIMDRDLPLAYLNPLQLGLILSPWRSAYYQALLSPDLTSVINLDLMPVGFFYQTLHGLALHYPRLAFEFETLKTIPFYWLPGLLGAIVLMVSIGHRFKPRSDFGLPTLIAIGVTGFSGMAAEITLLILFQVFLGVLYLEIGMLMAFFMAGLAGGAYLTILWEHRLRPFRRSIVLFQGTAAVFFLILLGTVTGMPGILEGVLRPLFYFLMIVSGGLSGAVYGLCSLAYFSFGKGIGQTAGHLYGLDLLGAALACVGIPFFLLPVWGMVETLLFLALISLLSAFLLWSWGFRSGEGGGERGS